MVRVTTAAPPTAAHSTEKIVIVLASDLPPGTAANTSALLSLSIGARRPDIIGPDVADADGRSHAGISTIPVPILHAAPDTLAELAGTDRVQVIGFTTTAAGSHTYPLYTDALAGTAAGDLRYLGLALIGPKKAVNSLTGALPLLR